MFSKQKGAFVQELKDILSEVEMFDKKGATYNAKVTISYHTLHTPLYTPFIHPLYTYIHP